MPPAPPSIVDVSLTVKQRVAFLFIIGLLLAVALAMALGWSKGEDRSIGLLVGAGLMVVVASLVAWSMTKVFRPRTLTVDGTGLSIADTGTRAFAFEWAEVDEVRVSYAFKAGTARWSITGVYDLAQQPATGAVPDTPLGVSTLVRLDLVPADASFLDRHPDMARWQALAKRSAGERTDDGWARTPPWTSVPDDRRPVLRVVFGPLPHLIPLVDDALRTHAGDRYQPPINEGVALGFRYS